MAGKRIYLPKGVKRQPVLARSNEDRLAEFDYDKALQADFEENRAQYTEVMLYGVPVKVKVTTTK